MRVFISEKAKNTSWLENDKKVQGTKEMSIHPQRRW